MFLEKLRNEPVPAGQRTAREKILSENKNSDNVITTSVITHAEAIPKKLTEADKKAADEYMKMFDARKIVDVEIDRNVIELARYIKDFYYKEKDDGNGYWMMDTADAIHLATAIINPVDEFHSRDNKKKKGNVPLLTLHEFTDSGKICDKYDLKIVSPEEDQADLLDV